MKFLNKKPKLWIFITALVVLVLQLVVASEPLIKPISWSSDLTFFYSLVISSLIIFPITLSAIFSYILDGVKSLNKRSFLLSFLIVSYFFVLGFILNFVEFEGFFEYSIRSMTIYYVVLVLPFMLIGLFIAAPLGWIGGGGSWYISGIAAMFIFSIVFAFFYSLLLSPHNGKKNRPKVIFILLVFLYLIFTVVLSINSAYVRTLILNKECAPGLNALECKDYVLLGGSYFSHKNDVYYQDTHHKLEGESADNFRLIDDDNEYFAVGEKVYYQGEPISGANVQHWKIIDNSEYYPYENRHSADDEHIYYGENVLPDADPNTTVVFDRGYACNDDFVYLYGKKIDGADPDTFAALNCGGTTKDKNHYYLYGKILENVEDFYNGMSCYKQVDSTCKEAKGY